MTTSWFDVPERVIIDWSHRCDAASVYRATVGTLPSCRVRSNLRDGTETLSTLRRWSSAHRADGRTVGTRCLWVFSVLGPRLRGTLCLDCCVTLATRLALVIL